jgi:hypothetical protein
MYLSLNTFSKKNHFLTKLNDFCVLRCENWRVTNVFLSMRSKGTMLKTQEESEWHFASFFLKKCFRSFSNSCLLFSSYLVCFEWFKIWWVHQLWLYKISLRFRGKNRNNWRF